jgi:hypothetical protein
MPWDVRHVKHQSARHWSSGEASIPPSLRALAEIKNYREGIFWKGRFDSFPEYVKARFNYKEQHAYRLAAAGDFVLQLEGEGRDIPIPDKEIQIRYILNKISKRRQVECWESIVSKYKPEEWTGDLIEAEVITFRKGLPKDELQQTRPLSKNQKKLSNSDARRSSLALVERLKKAVLRLESASEILKQIEKVERLIG